MTVKSLFFAEIRKRIPHGYPKLWYNIFMIILSGNKIERSFAGEVLFNNINIQVDERDRIALVGKNGAGKSTLLKILVGEEAATSGEISTKRDLSLSYLAQDSRFESENTIYDEMLHVFDDLRMTEKRLRSMEEQMGSLSSNELDQLMKTYDSLSEEFRLAGGFSYEADIRAILNGFKFDQTMWDMKISELSGGQNTRLALAKMLLESPELLVLDEPTNHLDIDSKEVLENALIDFDGTLLFVSHDRYFINRVATKVLEISETGSTLYLGDYDYYLEKKAELEVEAQPDQLESTSQSAGAMDYQAQKENQKEQRKLARRIEQIEAEIETIENRLSELNQAMLETNDIGQLTDYQKEIDQLTSQQESLMEEWEELSEQMG